MHRLIEEHLEEVLSGAGLPASHPAQAHLASCSECLEEIGEMREQAALLATLRAPLPNTEEAELAEPRPGFCARVWERIEARKPVSIWETFANSLFGRGLAAASLAVLLTMGAYLVNSELVAPPQPSAARDVVRETYPMLPAADFPDEVLAMPTMASADTNRGAVLMNLVTYHGR